MVLFVPLFDTHNHFDDPAFDHDRLLLVQQAVAFGVQKMVMTGITSDTFERILSVQQQLNQSTTIQTYSALGLHPFFIHQHNENDLHILESHLKTQLTTTLKTKQTTKLKTKKIIAIGEIGLDTFTKEMKEPDTFVKQQQFFIAQLDLAVKYQLPALLHIRKAHGDSLKILKYHAYKNQGYNAHELGGIAHSFSGGEQEAKAFVNLGFKLGITGQICNPNAKKLHKAIKSAVSKFGLECLVIESDCPDMMPLPCQTDSLTSPKGLEIPRNTPANLTYILKALSELLQVDKMVLSEQLWQNSLQALRLKL